MAPRIDLPTFVTLNPQATSITVRPSPQTTVDIRQTEASMAIERYEAEAALDSSVETSSQLTPQASTIHFRRSSTDMTIDQYEDYVVLDSEPAEVLIDA